MITLLLDGQLVKGTALDYVPSVGNKVRFKTAFGEYLFEIVEVIFESEEHGNGINKHKNIVKVYANRIK